MCPASWDASGSTRSTRNDRGDSGTAKGASIIGRVNDGQALSLQAPRQGQGDSRTCEVCGHRGAAGQPRVSGPVRMPRAVSTILPTGVHPRWRSTTVRGPASSAAGRSTATDLSRPSPFRHPRSPRFVLVLAWLLDKHG